MEMKSDLPECHEGPEAFSRFDSEVRALLSVPRSTLVRREKTYRKKVVLNPRKRGPKRKATA
jgi:hypothetical protein